MFKVFFTLNFKLIGHIHVITYIMVWTRICWLEIGWKTAETFQ